MAEPIVSFVCWKWREPGSDRLFEALHVNVLRGMVKRHFRRPHRFICVTDDAAGLDPKIEVVPMPVRFDLTSPQGKRFPQCYCRLWNFSREAREVLGERIFQLDIDCVIVDDITALVDRGGTFIGWCDIDRFGWKKIAGGAYLMDAGKHLHVWEDFDPAVSPAEAFAAGNGGSDQGWMSYRMYPPAARWTDADGLYKIGWLPKKMTTPPAGVRIAFTSGLTPPWSHDTQKAYPWVKNHWRR